MHITVSLIQMDVKLGDPESNLARAEAMVAEAARRGSDLVVLPELWSTGYALERAPALAAPLNAGLFAACSRMAQTHGIWLTGSLLEMAHDLNGICNTAILHAPTGECQGLYRKLHLFRLMEEDRYLVGGDRADVCALPWGATALAICYDLRFPELFRRYAVAGAQLVIVPAEWPHPRLAHWRTLLRARAIENQMFVIACNRVGESKGTQFCGHSAIIDPWGESVIEGGEDEIILTASVDLELVAQVRRRIPVFADRRPAFYGERIGQTSSGEKLGLA